MVRKAFLRQVFLVIVFFISLSLGDECSSCAKKECVKTISEPYYERSCSKKVACSKIVVPCGPPGDPTTCNYDEICVKYTTDCRNSTSKSSSKKPTDCPVYYRCEWRPYWEVDLNIFSVKCTELYTLKANESCADVMKKFILPLEVFLGFNPKLDCEEAKEGTKVCVHGAVQPKKPYCGTRRCAVGEECVPTDCEWKPKYGDRCGSKKCPLGYACKTPDGTICKIDGELVQGSIIPQTKSFSPILKHRSLKKASLSMFD